MRLPIEEILDLEPRGNPPLTLGLSRQGHEIRGQIFGVGDLHVSLIAGCHADEPVGPATLRRLATYLASLGEEHPALSRVTWYLVPHANPDGERRNATWSLPTLECLESTGIEDPAFDLEFYRKHVVRELPGDDIEFGFPRDTGDSGARPENRAVADFLAAGAPFHLHGSLHGMAVAKGPWFLLEAGWVERTLELRESLRGQARAMGYRLHDPDRRGEKGFHRIDEGFTTRPDSRAMATHFRSLGDAATAALFRPSSMELVRSLGGDPLTFVTEMPLFLEEPDGLRPMPIRDQIRLQLAFLEQALQSVIDNHEL